MNEEGKKKTDLKGRLSQFSFKNIFSQIKTGTNSNYTHLFRETLSSINEDEYEKAIRLLKYEEKKKELKDIITDNKIAIENITQECVANFNEYVANFKKDATNFSESIDRIEDGIRDRYYSAIIRSNEFINVGLDYISNFKQKIKKQPKQSETFMKAEQFSGNKNDSNIIDIPKKDIKVNKEKSNSSPKEPFYKRPITYLTASLAAAIIAGGLTIGYYTTDLNKKNSVVPTPKQAVEEVINEANALLAQKDLYIELAAAQDKFSKLVEPEKEYTVQKGDNLIKIGAKYDSNIYKKMNEWCKRIGKHPLFPNYVHADGSPVINNNIHNPNNIKLGIKIDTTYLQEKAIKNYETEKAGLENKINELNTALNNIKTEKAELSKKQAEPAENNKVKNKADYSDYYPWLAGITSLFSAAALGIGLYYRKKKGENEDEGPDDKTPEEKYPGETLNSESGKFKFNLIKGMEIKPEPTSIGLVVNAEIKNLYAKKTSSVSEKANYYTASPGYIALKQSNCSGKKPIYNVFPEFANNNDIQMINDYFNISAGKKTVKSINKEYSADIYSVLKNYNIDWTRTAAIKEKKLDRILDSAYLKNEEKLSVRNISEKLGISVSTVYAYLRDYNALIRNDIRNEQINRENNINITKKECLNF